MDTIKELTIEDLKNINKNCEIFKIGQSLKDFLRSNLLLDGEDFLSKKDIQQRVLKNKTLKQQEVFKEKCYNKLEQIRRSLINMKIDFILGIVRENQEEKGQDIKKGSKRELSLDKGFLAISIQEQLTISDKEIDSYRQYKTKSKGTLEQESAKLSLRLSNIKNEKMDSEKLEKEKNNILSLVIINNRINQIKNFYNTDDTSIPFETYYRPSGKKNEYIKIYREQNGPIFTYMTNRNRMKYWLNYNSIQGYTTYEKVRQFRSIKTGTREEGMYGTLVAYDQSLDRARAMQSNRGHEFEAYLHAASQLSLDKREFNEAEKFLENDKDENIFNYNINKREIINVDQAFLLATDVLPLFRGGDVNFILYQREGDKIIPRIKSYQAKAENASVNFWAVISGLCYLYYFLCQKNFTNFPKEDYKGNLKISFDNITLADIIYEDINFIFNKELSKIAENEANNILKESFNNITN